MDAETNKRIMILSKFAPHLVRSLVNGHKEGHGGATGDLLSLFILIEERLLNVNNGQHKIIELGSGIGQFGLCAWAWRHREQIICVECDKHRHEYNHRWVEAIKNNGRTRRMSNLPIPILDDFTNPSSQLLISAFQSVAPRMYLNNAGAVLNGEVQNKLSSVLDGFCDTGAILVTLDTFFHHQPLWAEVCYEVLLPRSQLSWLARNSQGSTKKVLIFKYTKCSEPQYRGKRRPRITGAGSPLSCLDFFPEV